MSRLALTPTNVPASASALTYQTLRTGDLYFNTSTGLMVYNGTAWEAVSSSTALTMVDGGVFDGIAPYNGGDATTTADQTVNGGTP